MNGERAPGEGIAARVSYRFVRAIVLSLCSLAFRVRSRGRARVPRSGALILAPSHRSILDIPFAAYVTRRRVCFMGKEELFRRRPVAWLFGALGGFPVERGTTDRAAFRAAQAVLERGEVLAIFPEGTRRHGPKIEDLFDGAAFLALRTGAPIVPIGIAGSEEILPSGASWPHFERVAVVAGDPIRPPAVEGSVRRRQVAELTATLRDAIQARFDEARDVLDES